MSNVNKVILVGRITNGPRPHASGGCILWLVTNIKLRGEVLSNVHEVSLRDNRLSKIALEHLKPGRKVYIEGHILEPREHSGSRILANSIVFLEKEEAGNE